MYCDKGARFSTPSYRYQQHLKEDVQAMLKSYRIGGLADYKGEHGLRMHLLSRFASYTFKMGLLPQAIAAELGFALGARNHCVPLHRLAC
jgi:hypothetical protein